MLASDLVSQAERRLYSGKRVQQNKLASSYTANGTTLTMTYDLDGISEGSWLAIDLEVFYVWEKNASAKTVTVEPAQVGSTAANHASGAIVYVDPLYPKFDIFQAINDDIESLPGEGLYRFREVDITYSAGAAGHNLTGVTDLVDIYDVVHKSPGLTGDWTGVEGWVFRRNQLTSDFASGYSIEFPYGAYPGQTVRVVYKAPFSLLTALTDNVESVTGLSTSQTKIPVIGAAAQLLSGREGKRAQFEHQGDSRRAEEVPVGAQSRATRDLLQLRQTWVDAEVRIQNQKYPPRTRR